MKDEDEMVRAHKEGLRMFEIMFGNEERAAFYMVARYHTDHEQTAFHAGFMGAKRRQQEAKR